MEKKVPVKTLYLLFVISIGLIGLGIGSTYALFTASAEIDSPITLSSNLSYNSDVIDTINVNVPAGETVTSTLNVTNSSGTALNYTVWYLDKGLDIEFGTSSGSPTGSLASDDSASIVVAIRNNTDSDVAIVMGIMSSSNSIVLDSSMVAVPSTELSIIDN